ncbi:MAG: formimidoylglutamate deiminase [Paraglaciecola sp.]|jgi:formimidoylglutamate deiminase
MSHQVYFVEQALLADGWAHNVRLEVEHGYFTRISHNASSAGAIKLSGPMLPTVANVHSHAFQRVMAGMAEVSLDPNDSFWSWRELMYQLVGKLSPQDVFIIARQLYIELLKAGYTQVGEFHYLHHAPQGERYAQPHEMSLQLIEAANQAGMGLTLLPVLYAHSGFGGQAPTSGQARFIHDPQQYLSLHNRCEQVLAGHKLHRLGICFHSLRAVSKGKMLEVLSASAKDMPVHIHIAEQQKEVHDCVQWSGQRPVAWLHNEIGLDSRWCLVHATHLDAREVKLIAKSGAVVGLCPTTEANLGDGLFPAVDFNQQQGRWAIGSDSHVSVSLVEDLKILEYGQRLFAQQRNRLHSEAQPQVGDFLFKQALAGGNQACGVQLGLAVGKRADFMLLDPDQPFIGASAPKDLLNRWIFGISANAVKDVYVAGKPVILNFRHPLQQLAAREFAQLLKRLMG